MTKFLFLITFLSGFSFGQSFDPAPDSAGTIAIKYDHPSFIAWATGGTITRGFVNINDTTITYDEDNRASYGDLSDALGMAGGNGTDVISLGDSGIATLTFDYVIQDGPGFDFAVFENGFTDGYMEFAHVEVSSNGLDYARFPSTSEIPLNPQLNNASISNCRYVNNLAGKYRSGYGTPFDLSELIGYPGLDVNNIQFVRLIDVVGDVDGIHTTTDNLGNPINDPFPTAFHSGGFDIDGVGIINGMLGLKEESKFHLSVYPNPAKDLITIQFPGNFELRVLDVIGNTIAAFSHHDLSTFDISELVSGVYFIQVHGSGNSATQSFMKR